MNVFGSNVVPGVIFSPSPITEPSSFPYTIAKLAVLTEIDLSFLLPVTCVKKYAYVNPTNNNRTINIEGRGESLPSILFLIKLCLKLKNPVL